VTGKRDHRPILAPERSGVYAMPADAAALKRAATEQNLAWMELDTSGARDKESLLEACAFSLDFPDSFGSNWDALSDCLRDFSWRPGRGYVIVWHGGATLAAAALDDFATALEVFRDAANYWKERGRIFIVLLDRPVPGLTVPPFRRS
jgi:RNAse (barnase) inhibitor barstar